MASTQQISQSRSLYHCCTQGDITLLDINEYLDAKKGRLMLSDEQFAFVITVARFSVSRE